MPASRPQEYVVGSKKLITLQSITEATAEPSPTGALKKVETPAVQATGVQELEKKLGEVKRENELLGRRFNRY